MTTRFFLAFMSSMASLLVGCSTTVGPERVRTNEQNYRDAIIDAMITEDSERSFNLTAIRSGNDNLRWKVFDGEPYILVANWTSWDTSYSIGAPMVANYDMWVTTVPELATWWHTKYDGRADTTLRLEQLLGLSPGRKKTHFLLVWVRPRDVFRPAGDPEIDDSTASSELAPTIDSTYRTWFNSSIIYSYYPKTSPWTRLGYTYDWSLQYGEIGLSEFVVRKGSKLIVHAVQTTAEHLRR